MQAAEEFIEQVAIVEEQVEQAEQAAELDVEEWRIVAGYDNYEVSNRGQVRNRRTRHVLVPQNSRQTGYLRVYLGRGHTKLIHQLVATAFIGDSEGSEVDHKNRDKHNNRASNLWYRTRAQNQLNKTGYGDHIFEYVDTLPEDAIVFDRYGNHEFENYYYHDGTFYFFNGLQYRVLSILTSTNGSHVVWMRDTTGRTSSINIAKYRRLIDDLP